MPKYMIELAHSPDACIAALDTLDARACDMLNGVYWGCMSGRHAGWIVVDAVSEEAAREAVPASIRRKVTVTQVQVASPDLAQAIDPNTVHPGEDEPFWS